MSRSCFAMPMPRVQLVVLPSWLGVLGWVVLVLGMLAYLCWLIAVLPMRFVPQQIVLRMAPGQQVVLGREELAAVQAGSGQLRLRRDLDGRWWGGLEGPAENIGKNLIWQDAGQSWRARTVRLEPGMVIPLSPALTVRSTDPLLTLQAADGRVWRFDGQRLLGQAAPACPQIAKYLKLEHIIQASHLPSAWLGRNQQTLYLGGNLHCGLRLAWPELGPQALGIRKLPDAGFELRLQSSQLPREFLSWLSKREFALRDGGELLLGRSAYMVELSSESRSTLPNQTLTLKPQARLSWFAQAMPIPASQSQTGSEFAEQSSPRLAWQWRAWSIWDQPAAWPNWLAASAMGISASVLLYLFLAKLLQSSALQGEQKQTQNQVQKQKRKPRQIHAVYPIACGLSLALALQAALAWVFGIAIGPAWIVCLLILSLAQACWFAWYAWPQLLGIRLVLGLLILLILTGLISQLALGVLAQETAGLRHFQTNASLLSVALALFFPVWLCLIQRVQQHSQTLPNICLGLAAAALAGLILEYLLGDETGLLGWIQPVELAKTGLILLGALCLAWFVTQNRQPKPNQVRSAGLGRLNRLQCMRQFIRQLRRLLQNAAEQARQMWQRWRAYLLPLLMFACLMLLVLVAVRDFSPLILLATWAWGVALALAWHCLARAHPNYWGGCGLLVLLLGSAWLLLRLGWGVYHDAILADLSKLPFWAERLQVWRAPELFPHSGAQFLQALSLAQQGSGMAVGMPEQPFDLTLAWRIPQIHNDFAPAFFIARFGLAAAQALLGLQCVYLLALWRVANLALRQANLAEGSNFRLRQLAMLRYFAITGLMAMMSAHFAISWGSNLGLLPVMGQPMPFVSAAGSMLLLFVMPLHLLLPPAHAQKLSAT